MPISYEPAQPIAPNLAASFGYNSTAAGYLPLVMQQRQMDAARQQHGAELATQQWIAQAGLAQQGQTHRDQMQHEDALATLNRGASDRDVFLAQNEMAQNDQRAQLAVWANNQEMTNAEAMRLQREKQSVADIMSRGDWTPQEKADAVTMLKDRIDIGQMRYQATQEKQLKQKMQVEQAQLEHVKGIEQRSAKIDNMGFNDRLKVTVDPSVQSAIEAELGPLQPTGSITEDAQMLAARAAEVHHRAGLRGGLRSFILSKDGNWEPVKHEGGADAQVKAGQVHYENQLKFHEAEVKRYDAAMTNELHALDKMEKPEERLSPEEKDRQVHERMAILFPHFPKDDKGRVLPPPTPGPPTPGMTPGQGQSPPAGGPPTPTRPAPQKDAMTTADDVLADFNKRPVAPQIKFAVNSAVEETKRILAEHGKPGETGQAVYAKLPANLKAQIDHNRAVVRQAMETSPPAPPAAPPQAPPAAPPNAVERNVVNPVVNQNPFNRGPLLAFRKKLFGG